MGSQKSGPFFLFLDFPGHWAGWEVTRFRMKSDKIRSNWQIQCRSASLQGEISGPCLFCKSTMAMRKWASLLAEWGGGMSFKSPLPNEDSPQLGPMGDVQNEIRLSGHLQHRGLCCRADAPSTWANVKPPPEHLQPTDPNHQSKFGKSVQKYCVS